MLTSLVHIESFITIVWVQFIAEMHLQPPPTNCCAVVSSRYSHSRATCARVSYTCATGGETHVPEARGATPPLVQLPAVQGEARGGWLLPPHQ